jgi:predicted TIM-barrel fold metal-dependent hydrolase
VVTIDCYCALGIDREFDLTADLLLPLLDKANVDRVMIAATDRQMVVQNREGNEFLLAAAKQHSNRFIPGCSVNPWYGNEAIHEMKRAIAEGARMLVLHPFVQGYVADDELVWPLLDVATQEKVPVYIHTGVTSSSSPFQIMNLANRYREVDFIIGHSGATDFWYDAIAAAKGAKNCYLESSCARPFNFSNYIKQLGPLKGIMGSFAPINNLPYEWELMRRFLSGQENEPIYGQNLQRLLEKRGPL